MAELPSNPTQSPNSEDRRRHPRFQPLAKVEFSGGGEVAVLPIADISAGGVRLSMSPDDLIELDIDERVSVFLEAAAEGHGGPVYVKVDATVVRIKRSDPAHLALEWQPRAPEAKERFEAVLRILESSTH